MLLEHSVHNLFFRNSKARNCLKDFKYVDLLIGCRKYELGGTNYMVSQYCHVLCDLHLPFWLPKKLQFLFEDILLHLHFSRQFLSMWFAVAELCSVLQGEYEVQKADILLVSFPLFHTFLIPPQVKINLSNISERWYRKMKTAILAKKGNFAFVI